MKINNVALGLFACGAVYVTVFLAAVTACGKPKIKTETEANGEVQVHQEIAITQDICTADNGFVTPEDRRQCILCMRDAKLCAPLAK